MKLVRKLVPLMSLAALIATTSAALCVGQSPASIEKDRGHRVVATGRLLGTRELQHILVSRSNGVLQLVIETVAAPSRVIWQTNSRNAETAVDSVRIADLDKDGIPEVLTLWRKSPDDAALRLFHWDVHQRAFVEVTAPESIDKVRSYRIVNKGGRYSSRVVVDSRAGQNSKPNSREYELRDAKLRLVIPGPPVIKDAAGGSEVKTTGESGIEGQTLISPAHPGPIRQGETGSAPYKTTIVVWNATDGREVKRVETGSDGRFYIPLSPGTYRVGSPQQQGRFLPRANEETVSVIAGKFSQVTLHFDSGMR